METFYRRMRRRMNLLLDSEGKPVGGQWNFDAENRKRLPAGLELPEPLTFSNPVGEIADRLEHHGVRTIGRMSHGESSWPNNRQQSLQLLDDFVERLLPDFGRYQDAMSDRGWALFHSRLSFSLNTKMLTPLEVVRRVVEAWEQEPARYPLASVEGFVRQIVGWREFIRGVYWSRMPAYASINHLGHERALPGFYWTGETQMACMAQAIGQSLDHAYAHHIQRLMVTGNFALLAGIDPDEVDAWYLGIYVDAIEWVEMPNTRGMSQFADGGVFASKPYAASGSYINRMGDHCKGCRYDVKKRSGPEACPFNSLYWHFMERNRSWQERNPRIGMIYRNWDRMDPDERAAILETANQNLERIESL